MTGFVLFGVAAWASAFVGILGSATVVAAGLARLDGTPITAREAISVAWSRRRELLAWALVTTLVSLSERLLERFGLAGAVIRLATDVAWSLATMLALPVIIAEGAMPAEAITVSAEAGEAAAGPHRADHRAVLHALDDRGAGQRAADGRRHRRVRGYRHDVPEWSAAGLIVAVASALGMFGAIAVLTSADAFLDTVLYRHAKGLPVSGIDSALLPAVADPSPFG